MSNGRIGFIVGVAIVIGLALTTTMWLDAVRARNIAEANVLAWQDSSKTLKLKNKRLDSLFNAQHRLQVQQVVSLSNTNDSLRLTLREALKINKTKAKTETEVIVKSDTVRDTVTVPVGKDTTIVKEGPPIDLRLNFTKAGRLDYTATVTPFRMIVSIGCEKNNTASAIVVTPQHITATVGMGTVDPEVCNPKTAWWKPTLPKLFLIGASFYGGYRIGMSIAR